jgi:hypothetical protein
VEKRREKPRQISIIMEDELLQNWEKKSVDHQKQYKQFLNRANKNKVLKALPDLHEEAFEKINCLQCANCCKSYSPRFKTPDIKRIAKYLKMKEGDLINTYLFVLSLVPTISAVFTTCGLPIATVFPIPMKMYC